MTFYIMEAGFFYEWCFAQNALAAARKCWQVLRDRTGMEADEILIRWMSGDPRRPKRNQRIFKIAEIFQAKTPKPMEVSCGAKNSQLTFSG